MTILSTNKNNSIASIDDRKVMVEQRAMWSRIISNMVLKYTIRYAKTGVMREHGVKIRANEGPSECVVTDFSNLIELTGPPRPISRVG